MPGRGTIRSWSARRWPAVTSCAGSRPSTSIKLEYGYLLFEVQTDHGPAQFTMRWTQSQVQDFAARGKVLLDVEDNRFLVPDVDELPQRERDLFQRYVYW